MLCWEGVRRTGALALNPIGEGPGYSDLSSDAEPGAWNTFPLFSIWYSQAQCARHVLEQSPQSFYGACRTHRAIQLALVVCRRGCQQGLCPGGTDKT